MKKMPRQISKRPVEYARNSQSWRSLTSVWAGTVKKERGGYGAMRSRSRQVSTSPCRRGKGVS
jgi:hypothetical protein